MAAQPAILWAAVARVVKPIAITSKIKNSAVLLKPQGVAFSLILLKKKPQRFSTLGLY